MASNQTFDSQDELITQADQRLQWDKITIEAIQHQIPLQVIPISTPNQPGLPHIGTLTETKRINGKQFIFMTDCSVLGNVVPKIKFDYDDIASLNLARVITPDSSNSFSIIPMEQTNAHEHQQIFSPERASTPTNWDDHIAMDEFDLSLSPIKSHISTTSSSSSSQEPHIPITTTAKRKLPVMADGFTLDQEYLELIWQMENPKIPFLEWCVDMQISDQMSMRKLMFGESIQKVKLFQNDPTNAPRIYESWKSSFEKHFLPFDEWYKPELVNKLPRSKLTITPFISMYHYHRDAHQLLLAVPADEMNDYLNLHLAWSSSLIRSHYLSFADWLQSPLQEPQYKQLAQRCQQLQLDKLPPVALQPYINLLKVSSEAMDDDYNNLHHFILDPNTTNLLQQHQTFPTQEQFYPHGQYSHIFMAHYVHVPYNVMASMKLREVQTYAHARHIIWSRMTTTRHSSHINNSSKFDHFTNQHDFTHVSPFMMIYLRQDKYHIEPTITSLQATQHIRAHEHLRLQGGLANMTEHEFYDLFLRPLEFLVTRGMPMHHQLLAAAHNYNARFNLFRNLIELAGFQITEPLPSDVHTVFQELSRVRHLDPFDLTDTRYHITNPLSRTDAMPTALDRRFTKSTSAAIKMSDFQDGGRIFQYVPSKYVPLPDTILEKFPELSGTKISIIDHHRLHQDVLTTYQTHLKQQQQQPKPAQRRQRPAPRPPLTQTPATPTATTSKTFAAVVAKQEPLSSQPTLRGRPDHRVPRQAPHPPPEVVESEQRKNPQAAHFWETETNISNEIEEWTKRQNQRLQGQPRQERSPEPSQQSTPNQSTQSVFQTQHNFASLEPQLFPEHYHPEVPTSELWRYNPNLQLTPPTLQPPWTHLQSPQQPHQLPTLGQVQPPFLTPANKFLQQEPQLMHLMAKPNVEFVKPEWMLAHIKKEDPKTQPIYPGDFLWPANSMYHVPESVKQGHSAASISRHMLKTIGHAQADRYKSMPTFRQIPLDGIFSAFNLKINFINKQSGEIEDIHIQVDETQWKPKNSPTHITRQTSIKFPSSLFHRLTRFLEEFSEIPIQPRINDMTSATNTLLTKTQRISTFTFTLSIRIMRQAQESDRMIHIHVQQPPEANQPESEIYFPWFQLSELVLASKDLYNELYENHYI